MRLHVPIYIGKEVTGSPESIRDGILHKRFTSGEPFPIMAYSVYVIFSAKLNKYYVGYSEDVTVRLEQHNNGVSAFTSKASDWELKYQENFDSREQAKFREQDIKRKKSRKYIEWLIEARS